MRISSWRHLLSALAVGAALVGCASTRPIPYSGVASASRLQPSMGKQADRVPYVYSGDVDWLRYSSVMVEPVVIYRGPDQQFTKVSEEDKQVLADHMQYQFGEALKQRFRFASQPEPGTLRVRLTLTGAKANTRVVSTFTKFDLVGAPYNTVQAIRGKEGLLSGSVSYAVEIFDAPSGRLVSAYVAKQYPSAMNVKASLGALGAAKTGIEKGADDLLYRMQ